MEFFLESIAIFLFEVLLCLPGACLRWFYFKWKKPSRPFKVILKEGYISNVLLTLLIFAVIAVLINI